MNDGARPGHNKQYYYPLRNIIKKKHSEFIKYKQVLKNNYPFLENWKAFYLSELRIDNAAILLIAITGCQEAGHQCHQVIGIGVTIICY